jgi:hypothetical protein
MPWVRQYAFRQPTADYHPKSAEEEELERGNPTGV